MIAIVDYKKGNLESVARAFGRAGASTAVTDDPHSLAAARAIVLPGVGAFADAMETLDALGLAEEIRRSVRAGKPFLGICLGLHLMYAQGTEHADGAPTPGLGIIEGTIEALPRTDAEGMRYKIPHVGWNTIEPPCDEHAFSECPLLDGLDPGTFLYFTHSFAAPQGPADVAHTTHSATFPSVVSTGNAFGVQFHPEKSSDAGARIIENFVRFANEV